MKNIKINVFEVEGAILKLEEVQESVPFIISALESMIDVTNDNKLFKVESEVIEKLDNIVEHIQNDYEDSVETLLENLSKILELLEDQDKANKKGIV